MQRFTTVDDYVAAQPQWRTALVELRSLLCATPLTETIKWGAPCYVLDKTNVVGLGAFKSYVGLWFYQGALLDDPDGVLINAQEGKTQALRQWRFADAAEIDPGRVRAYVAAAIELARQGRSVPVQRDKPLVLPPELATALADNAGLAKAFAGLTKGRQREYAEHVASAKRAETRQRRLARIIPMIAAGGGLNDKYRDC